MYYNRLFAFSLVSIILISCNKYKPFQHNYRFESENGKPDYSNLNYWAAHPWKWDPSDSVPSPLGSEMRDTIADVFFVHPTTHTKKKKAKERNAAIDDTYLNAKTDYSSILYQASVFNQHCRVFAPRYRQAHISTFFKKQDEETKQTFDHAYSDIKAAFEFYLQHWNKDRPLIIAAHSQGSKLAERLLNEFFDHPENDSSSLRNKLVVAYLAGWPVPVDYFTFLEMCKDSLQTGCLCSWRTLRKGYVPSYLKSENGSSYASNPLLWTITGLYASRELNKGSVLWNFNKIYKHTTDAAVSNGFLFVRKPKFPWSFLYLSRNYHIGDINLFYLNIRENAAQRIQSYINAH